MRVKKYFKNPLIVMLFFFGLMVILPSVLNMDPLKIDPMNTCSFISKNHLLGADEVGRDILARVLHGLKKTLIIGLLTTLFSCLLGSFLGLIAGYFGKITDIVISQFIDVSLAFPSLLLAIAISVILPPSEWSVIIAISASGWASFARMVRSMVIQIKNKDFVIAAKTLGSGPFQIVFRHILPHCTSLIIVSASLKCGSFMLAESGLSFLGLGVPAPHPTLGGMISTGRDVLFAHPHISIIPGFVIAAIVLWVNLVGEWMQKKYLQNSGKI